MRMVRFSIYCLFFLGFGFGMIDMLEAGGFVFGVLKFKFKYFFWVFDKERVGKLGIFYSGGFDLESVRRGSIFRGG